MHCEETAQRREEARRAYYGAVEAKKEIPKYVYEEFRSSTIAKCLNPNSFLERATARNLGYS